MQIGVFSQEPTVTALVDRARDVAARGFGSLWVPQIFDLDAMTALAVVAHEVPGLRLGTAVVPTFPRHPMVMAAQARTVHQITEAGFTLGIGLSHQIVIESLLGMDFAKPVRHLREYLSILMPLLHDETAAFAGETLTANNVALTIPDSTPVPVVVAALGPQLLKLAGTRTEGTVTWMTGPKTIAEHTAPTLRAAAEAAGRPEPKIFCSLPMSVTDDVEGARARADQELSVYGTLPSYRAMLDREGASGPGSVAIVGTADQVAEGVMGLEAAGVTTALAAIFGSPDEQAATREVLSGLR